MVLSLRARKLALTSHIVASVGWFGAVATFTALSVFALVSDDLATVRGAYPVMEAAGWAVLVPLSVASLVTGVIQGLGTRWGVLRHYWVVFKLVINVVGSIVLVLYMQTLGALADDAAAATEADGLASPSPVVHSGGAIVLLLVATGLPVYKPKGLTARGRRAQRTGGVEPIPV
jgi:uncharacterized membrane protein